MENNEVNNTKEPILYIIVRPLITILFKIVFRPKIIGSENIPKDGSIVLAGNHTKSLDCLLVMSSTKRTVHFLAKDSLSKGLKGVIFRSMGIIPVNRKIHDKDALLKAKKVLEDSKVIGIFPEGTVNKTNDVILPFKIGSVKMAYDTKSKIVPFIIKGKYNIFKNRISIEFLKPYIPKDSILDNENNKLMKLIKTELGKE